MKVGVSEFVRLKKGMRTIKLLGQARQHAFDLKNIFSKKGEPILSSFTMHVYYTHSTELI
jgi:hypothetical protein